MTTIRALSIALLIVATGVVTRARSSPAPRPAALAALPMSIGIWRGIEAPPLDAATRRELGADAYVNRTYAAEGGSAPVGLYVAYYAEQRPNVSIHSPLHCLPGTGWEPLDVATVSLDAGTGARIPVRRMVIRKNLDRDLVLYWYAVHGRVIASELTSKLWLLHDSLRLGRSDAALVRIAVPIQASADAAEAQGAAFARALLPHVTF